MAANVVSSFNQITFRTGLLFSLGGIRIHCRKFLQWQGYHREHSRSALALDAH
jgi:hypothetical protein